MSPRDISQQYIQILLLCPLVYYTYLLILMKNSVIYVINLNINFYNLCNFNRQILIVPFSHGLYLPTILMVQI